MKNKFNPTVYATRLCLELGLKHSDMWKILKKYNSIIKHNNWASQRSNRGLLVDCVYLYCKKEEMGISIEKLKRITKKEFGVCTQPRPNRWSGDYELQSIVKHV